MGSPPQRNFKYQPKGKMFGNASEMMEGFCSVIPAMGLH
jgi:hypothetical protein